MIPRIILILILNRLDGFFDGVMDMIKDFPISEKNWLYQWALKHPDYLLWLQGQRSLPFFDKRGYQYNPKYPWFSDAWHMAKHFMEICASGVGALALTWAIALYFNLAWYFEVPVCLIACWLLYWSEGDGFNDVYQPLK